MELITSSVNCNHDVHETSVAETQNEICLRVRIYLVK